MSGGVRKFSPAELAELRAYDAKIDGGHPVPHFAVRSDGKRDYSDYNRWYYQTHRDRLLEKSKQRYRENYTGVKATIQRRVDAAVPFLESNPLRVWRKRRKLTQEQASKRFGCSAQSIYNWEHSRYPIPERVRRVVDPAAGKEKT